MVLRFDGKLKVENLGNCPAETLEELRALLAAGAPSRPDPRRQNFYEVANGSREFFIYVSPSTGKVALLASWLKEPAAARAALDDRSFGNGG
jgi:hypothetical protein